MKCECFCNGHCCTSDCPNIRCDEFEEYYDIPASDSGYERVECKDCIYDDQHCDCDDCYFNGSEHCPKNGGNIMKTTSDIIKFLWEIARDYQTPLGLSMTLLAIHMLYEGGL